MLWLPSIHKLTGARNQKFHDLKELAQAAGSRARGMLDDWYLLRCFIHVTLRGIRLRSSECAMVSSLELRDEFERTATIFGNNEMGWLRTRCSFPAGTPLYVPAGWGMKVLEAIDHGAEMVDLLPLNDKILEVGIRIDGSVFMLATKQTAALNPCYMTWGRLHDVLHRLLRGAESTEEIRFRLRSYFLPEPEYLCVTHEHTNYFRIKMQTHEGVEPQEFIVQT